MTERVITRATSAGAAFEAQQLLPRYLRVTSLLEVPGLTDSTVHLKNETELPTGSFKVRGALYALARELRVRPISEVVASSTGNHGAAVAWAAEMLGVAATIFLPENPNAVKRKRIEESGARVVEVGEADLAAAAQAAMAYSRRPGIYYLNDATDPNVTGGAATIGLEILDQLPDVASIYAPIGDTALIRGLATVVKDSKPRVTIIGVQAERAPSYYLSWKSGKAIPTSTCDTCADGLATRIPEPDNVTAICKLVDDIVLVSDEEMIRSIRLLYEQTGIVAEPAGIAATAAFLKQSSSAEQSGPAVALVTGRNISSTLRIQAGLPESRRRQTSSR
jgi:threonine dehydratase